MAFANKLRESNPLLPLDDVGFVDFEPREDPTRHTTISLEFAEVDHANAVVRYGIVWDGKCRETEHFNLTCNLNFKNDHEKYCEEVQARRIDERRRREEEGWKDVMFRRSKLVHPVMSLVRCGYDIFPAVILNGAGPAGARICESSTTSQKRPRDDEGEEGMAGDGNGRKRPRIETGQHHEKEASHITPKRSLNAASLSHPEESSEIGPVGGAGEEQEEAVPGLLDGGLDRPGGSNTLEPVVVEAGEDGEVEET